MAIMRRSLGYHFVIPSKGRSSNVSTISELGIDNHDVTIVVNTKKEAEEYTRHYMCEILVSNVEGITLNRNWILDHFGLGKRIITLCDDVKGLFRLNGKNVYKLDSRCFYRMCNSGFEDCEKYGTKLWGVYPIKNHFFMSESLSPNNFIIGTFSGIIISDIRMDNQMILKEDYDFTIKHILKYKKVLRYNYYAVEASHYKNKGGCVDYRNDSAERQSINRLLELYPNYVRENPKRPNEILLTFRKERKS
jgi:hypothetical protein